MSKNTDFILFTLGALAGGALVSLFKDNKRRKETLNEGFDHLKKKIESSEFDKEIQDTIEKAKEKIPEEIKKPLDEIFDQTF